MNKHIDSGDSFDYLVPSGGVVAGEIVDLKTCVGIVHAAAAEGDLIRLSITGTIEADKLGSDDVTQGDKLYWDDGNSRFTLTASTHTFAGIAARDDDATSTVARCRLCPGANEEASNPA